MLFIHIRISFFQLTGPDGAIQKFAQNAHVNIAANGIQFAFVCLDQIAAKVIVPFADCPSSNYSRGPIPLVLCRLFFKNST
jgi:hypothetical protein